jgi:hypothetical protein
MPSRTVFSLWPKALHNKENLDYPCTEFVSVRMIFLVFRKLWRMILDDALTTKRVQAPVSRARLLVQRPVGFQASLGDAANERIENEPRHAVLRPDRRDAGRRKADAEAAGCGTVEEFEEVGERAGGMFPVRPSSF